MGTLLRQGRVHCPDGARTADLLIQADRISLIAEKIDPSSHEVIDCTGLEVLPGLIDAHVHFRDPGNPDKETFASGSKAAAAGGVTTVLDMPNNVPPVCTPVDLEQKRRIASSSHVNYGLYVLGYQDNLDHLACFENIPGIKVYLGSSTGNYLTEDLGVLISILERARVPVVVHAENESLLKYFTSLHNNSHLHHKIRDPLCALVSVAESTLSADYFGKRLHLAHVSTRGEIEYLRRNKTHSITCEVSPHHLFLNEAFFLAEGNRGKMNPPLRRCEDQDALWMGIEEGIVDMIATDHAPHSLTDKNLAYPEAPCGVPGVQTLLPLLLNAVNENRLSLERLVQLCSQRPAEVFGITNRGIIKCGYFADLVLVDMGMETVLRNEDQHSKCGWTPFHGMRVRGFPVKTLVNGTVIYEKGEVSSKHCGREVNFDNREGEPS